MARKVFISFLGTNNYLQTRYVYHGEESPAVRFVQQALIGFVCKDWTENDCVMIFYTKESCKRNWLDNGQGENVSEIENTGLQSCLQSMNLPMQVNGYEIAEGFSEEEIWSIFDCVYNQLQKEDEIYFDVTHAFRSIPLFSTVLFNFSRFMKSTRLKSILYGAFEKLGSAFLVKQQLPNPEGRKAPIVDLTSLAELQTTNIAANDFIEFGKVGTIADQLDNFDNPSEEQRSASVAILTLKRELANLDEYIQTCKMEKIKRGQYIKNVRSCFETVVDSGQLQNSEKLLLQRILESLEGFEGANTDKNIHAAIKWAFHHGMLQQAYTLGQEFIASKFCALLKRDECVAELKESYTGRNGNKLFREFSNGILGIPEYEVKRGHFEGVMVAHRDIAEKLLMKRWIKQLRRKYDILRSNRNTLNHAKDGKDKENLWKEFNDSYFGCIGILNNMDKTLSKTTKE